MEDKQKRFLQKNPNYHKEYYQKNKIKLDKKNKTYKKDERIKEKYREYKKNWKIRNKKELDKKNKIYKKKYSMKEENKIKIKAQGLAKRTPVQENQMCEMCLKNKAVLRHHANYNKPLKIKYLCKICHYKIHH